MLDDQTPNDDARVSLSFDLLQGVMALLEQLPAGQVRHLMNAVDADLHEHNPEGPQ